MHPKTKKRPVIDTIHGYEIIDPYRWLEDGESQPTQEWVAQQRAFTTHTIGQYGMKAALKERFRRLKERPEIHAPTGHQGTLIYQRREIGQNHSVLYAERQGTVHVVSDPNQGHDGQPAHVDWAEVSHDGQYVLFGISRQGDEWATLRVYDVNAKKLWGDEISRARHASVAFVPGQSGFFYTRYPHPGEYPQIEDNFYHVAVFYHRLGSDESEDVLVFRPPHDPRAIPRLLLSNSCDQLVVNVHYGWTRNVLFTLDPKNPEPSSQLLLDPGDVTLHTFWERDRLLVLTSEGQHSMISEVLIPDGTLHPLIKAQPRQPLLNAVAWDGKIAAHVLDDGESQLTVFDGSSGTPLFDQTLPGFAGLEDLSAADGSLYYQFSGFGQPTRIHRLSWDAGEWVNPVWAQSGAPDPRVTVTREWVTSQDGTLFPLLIARHQESLDVPVPTVLAGYGGFNVPYLPTYSPSVHDWIIRGGLYAVAMIRGGGEFGDEWHRLGMRDKKQAVFDDFYAASQYLTKKSYTDAEHLAVSGRSNGGLLTGAFVTQHPKAARAVVIGVPLLDMIRFHRFLIADLWTSEYGSPDRAQEYEWLIQYSPYHRVQDQIEYPAILLFTSERDSRVDPMHARKMAARLQNATTSEHPVLLRVASQAGHGVGKSSQQWLDEESDIWAFLSHHLNLSVPPV